MKTAWCFPFQIESGLARGSPGSSPVAFTAKSCREKPLCFTAFSQRKAYNLNYSWQLAVQKPSVFQLQIYLHVGMFGDVHDTTKQCENQPTCEHQSCGDPPPWNGFDRMALYSFCLPSLHNWGNNICLSRRQRTERQSD